MPTRCPFPIRKIASALALIGYSSWTGATLVADGKLGDGPVTHLSDNASIAAAAFAEGYTQGWAVTFYDSTKAIGTGQIFFGTAVDGSQYLYYQLPLSYVDNTYGLNSSPGWKKGHTFDNLLGSDSMGEGPAFTWVDKKTGATNTARIDYIADCYNKTVGAIGAASNCGGYTEGSNADLNSTTPTKFSYVSGYMSGGVGPQTTSNGVVTGADGSGSNWTKVDAALTGSAASILEIATSLEWDLNNVCPTCTVNSSTDVAWLKEVGYELKFASGTFDPATFGTTVTASGVNIAAAPGILNLGDPHVSPPMATLATFGSPCMINPTTGTCGGAPEPGTAWLLGLALGGLGAYARRRSKKSRQDKTDPPSPDKPEVPAPS